MWPPATAISWLPLILAVPSVHGQAASLDPDRLPDETLFPGPWERYIKAPLDKTRITPARIWATYSNVTTSSAPREALAPGGHVPGHGIVIGPEGRLTLEFEENVGGRVCFDIESVGDDPEVYLAYSESSVFADELPDATTDRQERDLPLHFEFGNRTGVVCVGEDFVRGGFKYLTIRMPVYPVFGASGPGPLHRNGASGQLVLGQYPARRTPDRDPYATPWVSIRNLWVNCTAFPSQANGRAYSGYFFSSDNLLNRIWYAGAYTLQLSTIDPTQGSALIDDNRLVDHNKSPVGSWYSNFTVANGTAVITDGAKRDRIASPEDLFLAASGIAVSTFDMLSIRNALDALFEHQYADGSLPRAGPPVCFRNELSDAHHLHVLLGVYVYARFSGDVPWLTHRWPAYLHALDVSIAKVDNTGLLHISTTTAGLRHGQDGHSLEASALLSVALDNTLTLARWLHDDNRPEARPGGLWHTTRAALHAGIQSLYCPSASLYAANLESHHCHSPDHLEPQAGNAWAILAGAASGNVSRALSARWLAHGAPAPEVPGLISPLASGIELGAHAAARRPDAAVELALREWAHLLDGAGFTNSTLAEGFAVDHRRAGPPLHRYAARTSHCRSGAAGPTGFLTEQVVGIVVTAPGGSEWEVRPRLTRWLGWVRGGFATARGQFEVKVSRVVALGEEDGVRGSGQVVELRAPEGTAGMFVWDDDHPGIQVVGGKTLAFVIWGEGPFESAPVEELDISPGRRDEADSEEEWYLQVILYREGIRLIYDNTFTAPEVGSPQVSVVEQKQET